MGPKVDAACRFVEHGRQPRRDHRLAHIAEAVHGDAGTVVVRRRRWSEVAHDS